MSNRIPFDRALDFANKEKITDQLYPLFVHNIGGLLYHPTNESRTSAVVAATERRRIDGVPALRNGQTSQPPPLHHHHSMHSTVGSQVPPAPHSIAPHPGAGRPGLDRAHTFPTPPTSASSVMGMGNQGSSYEWGAPTMGSSVTSTQPLSIDTGLSNNARSLPTTPATTPPGSSVSNMQSYQSHQGFDGTKSFYSGPPSSQSGYAPQQTSTQQNMARFGGPLNSTAYPKNEMGPPSAPGAVNAGDAEHHDIKSEQYAHGHVSTGSTDAEGDHHENSYMGANASAYNNNRTQYAYNPPSSVGTVQSDHSHLSPEMTGSPHQGGSGRATPRGTNGAHQWQQGYQTPPRAAPSSNLYNVMIDSRGANGTPNSDHYASNYTSTSMNGTSTSNKRGRDDDSDTGRPDSRGMESGFDLKRRKTMGMPMGQMSSLQGIKTGGGLPRQR